MYISYIDVDASTLETLAVAAKAHPEEKLIEEAFYAVPAHVDGYGPEAMNTNAKLASMALNGRRRSAMRCVAHVGAGPTSTPKLLQASANWECEGGMQGDAKLTVQGDKTTASGSSGCITLKREQDFIEAQILFKPRGSFSVDFFGKRQELKAVAALIAKYEVP